MNSLNPLLTPEALAALDLPVAERSRWMFREKFISYERINWIKQAVSFRVWRPPTVRATGLVVTGESGSGKTMLAESVLRDFPLEFATPQNAAHRHAIMISMSEAREAGQIYQRFLEAFGYPHPERLTREARRLEAFRIAVELCLKLLIVDEIQDILIGTIRQQQLALEVIKAFMNALKIPVLAFGTPEAKYVMEANPHLKTRFEFPTLPRWKAGPHLAHFLEALENSLPLKERSRLSSDSSMRALVKASEGVLSNLVERVCRAAALAVEQGDERIKLEHIQRAEFELPKYVRRPDKGGVS